MPAKALLHVRTERLPGGPNLAQPGPSFSRPCPSSGAREISQTLAHLVDPVLAGIAATRRRKPERVARGPAVPTAALASQRSAPSIWCVFDAGSSADRFAPISLPLNSRFSTIERQAPLVRTAAAGPSPSSRPGSRRPPTANSDSPASAAGRLPPGCAARCCRCTARGGRARGAAC